MDQTANAMNQTAPKHAAHVAAYRLHLDTIAAAAWEADHVTDMYEAQSRADRNAYGSDYFAQTHLADADDAAEWLDGYSLRDDDADAMVIDAAVADIDSDHMTREEAHGLYNVEDFTAHITNRQLIEQRVAYKTPSDRHPRHSTELFAGYHGPLMPLTEAAAPFAGDHVGNTYAPKRWTDVEAKRLAKRMAQCTEQARYYGIADIVGRTKTKADNVSRAAQYASKQDATRRADKRAAKRNAKLAGALARAAR